MNTYVGTIVLFSKQKHGYNSKNGKQYFMFKPLNPGVAEFKITVSSKRLITANRNVYALVKKHEREEGCIMEIVDVFGFCHEFHACSQTILYKYLSPPRKPLSSAQLTNPTSIHSDFHPDSNLETYEEFHPQLICSIDPENCEDIDDALSITSCGNGFYILGIHITDIEHAIATLQLEDYFQQQPFTIYSPHKIYHSLPNVLNLSLTANNTLKKTLTLMLYIQNGVVLQTILKKTEQIIQHNYTYEQADQLIDTDAVWTLFSNIVEELIQHDTIPILSIEKSHRMVDYLMVYCNRWIAQQLVEHYTEGDQIILRQFQNQTPPSSSTTVSESTTDAIPMPKPIPTELVPFEQQKETFTKKAKYILYAPELEHCGHDGLNCSYYTHFTSPLRRYVDVLIHRQIKQVVFQTSCPKVIVNLEHINQFEHQLKKAEKHWNWLKYLQVNLQNQDSVTTECFIVDWKQTKQHHLKLYLYFHHSKIYFHTILIHHQMMAYFQLTDQPLGLMVQNMDTRRNVMIQKNMKIQVQIWWDKTKGIEGTRIVIPQFQCLFDFSDFSFA